MRKRKFLNIMSAILIAGNILASINGNVAYAGDCITCQKNISFEYETPALTFDKIEEFKQLEENKDKTNSEIYDWYMNKIRESVDEKAKEFSKKEDLGTIELADAFEKNGIVQGGVKEDIYTIKEENQQKIVDYANSKVENSDFQNPRYLYFDEEKNLYYAIIYTKYKFDVETSVGVNLTVKTEKPYVVYVKPKDGVAEVSAFNLSDAYKDSNNKSDYKKIIFEALKKQMNTILNIEEDPEHPDIYKDENQEYVYGYVTNKNNERTLTKIYFNKLEIGDINTYNNPISIKINDVDFGLSDEVKNKIEEFLNQKYGIKELVDNQYQLKSNEIKKDWRNTYYVEFENPNNQKTFKFYLNLESDDVFNSFLKNFNLNSEEYKKYSDFKNLMIKDYGCQFNKVKKYIATSDGNENIDSYLNKNGDNLEFSELQTIENDGRKYNVLITKSGKKYVVEIKDILIPNVKLYDNPLDVEEKITEEDTKKIEKVMKVYFKDQFKSLETDDKVRIDPCGRAYLKIKIYFNDNNLQSLEKEIRVNRTISDRASHCPPTVTRDYEKGIEYQSCQKETDCHISGRYSFEIENPNDYPDDEECVEVKPGKPSDPDEPESPKPNKPVDPIPSKPTEPVTPSNITPDPKPNGGGITPKPNKPSTPSTPSRPSEPTPVTIINKTENKNNVDESQLATTLPKQDVPQSEISRNIKTGDNMFNMGIMMMFSILGLAVYAGFEKFKTFNFKKRE